VAGPGAPFARALPVVTATCQDGDVSLGVCLSVRKSRLRLRRDASRPPVGTVRDARVAGPAARLVHGVRHRRRRHPRAVIPMSNRRSPFGRSIYELATARRAGEAYARRALAVVNSAATANLRDAAAHGDGAVEGRHAGGGVVHGGAACRRALERTGCAAVEGVRESGMHPRLHRSFARHASAVVRHGVLREHAQGSRLQARKKQHHHEPAAR
jgi:hypothetical protein